MNDSRNTHDPFVNDLRGVLLDGLPSQDENDALHRIKHSWLRTPTTTTSTARTRRRLRSRPRALAVAMASLLVVTGATAAAAQSSTVRGLFTKDTPSADRIKALSITGSPSGTKADAANVPAVAQQQLNSLYAQDDDLHRVIPGSGIDPSGQPPTMQQRYGTLAPDDQTQALVAGTWNGHDVGVYARSTSKGAVCYVDYVQGNGESASACFASFFDLDAPIAVNGTLHTSADGVANAVMFGLAADEVTGVTVHLKNGGTEEALMGTNAFYWDESKSHSAPTELDVHFSNGTSVTRPIDTNPPKPDPNPLAKL
jgi:hypothetical protein